MKSIKSLLSTVFSLSIAMVLFSSPAFAGDYDLVEKNGLFLGTTTLIVKMDKPQSTKGVFTLSYKIRDFIEYNVITEVVVGSVDFGQLTLVDGSQNLYMTSVNYAVTGAKVIEKFREAVKIYAEYADRASFEICLDSKFVDESEDSGINMMTSICSETKFVLSSIEEGFAKENAEFIIDTLGSDWAVYVEEKDNGGLQLEEYGQMNLRVVNRTDDWFNNVNLTLQ